MVCFVYYKMNTVHNKLKVKIHTRLKPEHPQRIQKGRIFIKKQVIFIPKSGLLIKRLNSLINMHS